ncbi:ribonuclease P protein component [Robiginitalea sp. IMCC44478]|uniref:ribonuclease P protein component n=1 Tax=Robiginitalea sp. IMCC44478 TaxID=3459122 RepID=UPI004041E487
MVTSRFPKSERLSGKKRWELLFREGKQLKAFPLSLYYLPAEKSDPPGFRAGFAVPKRSVKKAVDRNRIKRHLREAYRTQKPQFFNNTEGSYALVFLYLGKKLPEYHQLEKAVYQLLQKFCSNEKIHQN